MKTKLYNVDYFLNKFSAIPEDKWITDQYERQDEQCCALGHCGERNFNYGTIESATLRRMFKTHLGTEVESINDGLLGYSELGDSPKERIINALILIKAGVSI